MNASMTDVGFVLALTALAGLLAVARPRLPSRWFVRCATAGSAVIIGFASIHTLVAIAAIAFGWLYPLHLLSRRAKARGAAWPSSRTYLVVGLAGLVALMVLFKAHQAFTLPLFGHTAAARQLAAIIGFSYFFFRAYNFLFIQRVFDVGEVTPSGLLMYVLFPPTLTSGPIQRYTDFQKQLTGKQTLGKKELLDAGYRITRGYFRKICLATFLSDAMFALLKQRPTGWSSVLTMAAMYAYYYFDFAGYSDIAIGFGQLLGIRVPENFKNPFLAASIQEFWRNWHITLADWFRDHVFFPLGGIRGKVRGACVAFLVMGLCGLWHGFSLMFLTWGLFHGLNLGLEMLLGTKPLPPALRHGPSYWGKVAWANVRVTFSMLMFLPSLDDAFHILRGFVQWR